MSAVKVSDLQADYDAHHPGRIALACAGLGWRVFPARYVNGKKRAAIKRWPEVATTDEATIYGWWRDEFPGALCGIATGRESDLWVFDVDDHDALARLVAAHGPLPQTFTVRTAGGGLHYYFRYPAGHEIKTIAPPEGHELHGLDSRGWHGLVLAPNTRATLKGDGTWADYEVLDDAAPTYAPDWLVDLYEKKSGETHEAMDRSDDVDAIGRALNVMRDYADQLAQLPHAEGSGRNGLLNKAAFTLGGFGAHGLVTRAEAHDALLGAAEACGLVEDDGVDACEATFESGWSAGQRNPIDLTQGTSRGAGVVGDDLGGFFRRGGGLNVQNVASAVRAQLRLARLVMIRDRDDNDALWYYDASGVWRPGGATAAERVIARLLGNRLVTAHVTNTLLAIRTGELELVSDGPPHPEMLNFTNEMLRWSDLATAPHDPAWYSTVQLGVPWQPQAVCPTFDAWLLEVVPEDAVAFALEMLGYLMLNGNPMHKAFLLKGTGRNGKGTYLRIAKATLGDRNCAAVPLQTMSENRFSKATLHMRLANIAGDLAARHVGDTSDFKMATGQDMVYAERKHGHPFWFVPWAVPIFSANQTPTASDTSVGYLSRWEVLPFPYDLTGRIDPDKETRIIAEELPGVARRGVEALQRLMLRGGFERPPSVQEALEEFEAEVDQVRAWIAERVVRDPAAFTTRAAAYSDYSTWAALNEHGVLSAGNFYSRLEVAGFRRGKRNNQRGFVGISLHRPVNPLVG